jgi:hypothetical protein
MIQRKVKRNVKRIIIGILIILLLALLIFSIVLSIKNVLPLLRGGNHKESAIIKPVLNTTTTDGLSKALSDKDLIMESLTETSSSEVIIGQIKDGPKVYFSKNKDAEWQALSLKLILNKLTVDNKRPTLIDLLGKQPIVKF